MRKLMLILVLLVPLVAQAGIYNNSGTTAEDSICIVVQNVSPDGENLLPITTSDSLLIMVFAPSGTWIFSDSMACSDAQVTISDNTSFSYFDVLTYKNSVAAMTSTGWDGTWRVFYALRDVDSSTVTWGWTEFQLYETANFSDKLDSLGKAPLTSYDPPTNTEMIARTMPTGDYFLFDSDAVANVTSVGSVAGAVGSVTGAVGSVTGSVGSVTGAVGSVTGAVGSVTGAVGSVAGNVDGSVGSVIAEVTADVQKIDGVAAAATNLEIAFDAEGDTVSTTGLANRIAALNDPTAAAIVDEWESQAAIDPTGFKVNVMEIAGAAAADIADSVESNRILTEGEAQAGAASTITLAAGESATDDIFNHSLCVLVGGTGVGQAHTISDYNGTTKVATVIPAWTTQPDITSDYVIYALGQRIIDSTGVTELGATNFSGTYWGMYIDSTGIVQGTAHEVFNTDTNHVDWNDNPLKFGGWAFKAAFGSGLWNQAEIDSLSDWLSDYYAHDLDSLLPWAVRIVRDSISDTADVVTALKGNLFPHFDGDSITTPTADSMSVRTHQWFSSAVSGGAGAGDSNHVQIPDSLMLSRLVKRWIWGIAVGSGSDSSTYAQRLIGNPGSAGSGANAVTFVAYDSTTGATAVVPSANINVYNAAIDTWYATVQTGTAGIAAANLDAADYAIIVVANGVTFPVDTVTVTATQTDTIKGYAFDPGDPDTTGWCRVFGWEKKPDKTGVEGALIRMTFKSSLATLFYGTNEYLVFPKETVTDSDGYWYMDLIPNVHLDSNSYYLYSVEKVGAESLPSNRKVVVPVADNANITTITKSNE